MASGQNPTGNIEGFDTFPDAAMRATRKREGQLLESGRGNKMTTAERRMGAVKDFANFAGAPMNQKVGNVSTEDRDFSSLNVGATEGAGLFPLPQLDRFSSFKRAGMELTVHDDGATQSGNSQSDHVVTTSVILAQNPYGSDYYKLDAMQRRLPLALPLFGLTLDRVDREMDPRQHIESLSTINWMLHKRNVGIFTLDNWTMFKRRMRFAGSGLHMLHNPEGGRMMVYQTMVVDGRIDLANIWLAANEIPVDGSRLFLLAVQCTDGCEEDELKARTTGKLSSMHRDAKKRYWRFIPYVLNRPGKPDNELWNDFDWDGLCIYIGRVNECGGSQGEPSKYRTHIQNVLHPRGDNFNNESYKQSLEFLPRITVSVGFGGGF